MIALYCSVKFEMYSVVRTIVAYIVRCSKASEVSSLRMDTLSLLASEGNEESSGSVWLAVLVESIRFIGLCSPDVC